MEHFFLYKLVLSDSDVYCFNFRVALATKENLQSQRGVLHGVTNRLSAVTSILLLIQLKNVVYNVKTRPQLRSKFHFLLWIRNPQFSRWWLVSGTCPLVVKVKLYHRFKRVASCVRQGIAAQLSRG